MTRRLNSTEAQEQKALIQWANLTTIPNHKIKIGDLLIHIANERACDKITGYNLKLMGVKKGVSDLFFAYPLGSKRGLWLEMKSKIGKLMFEQAKFLDTMKEVGYEIGVARGFDEGKSMILNYLKGG